MKKNIRKIKQELRNFSLSDFAMRRRRHSRGRIEESEAGKSKSQLLQEKCRIINRNIFGEDESLWKNPKELEKLLYTCQSIPYVDDDDEEGYNLCIYLKKILWYLMGSEQFRPSESIAVYDASKKLASMLQEAGYGADKLDQNLLNENLVLACDYNGNFDDVKKLIKAGADINYMDSCGSTPLSKAITHDENIAKYLIQRGAIIDNPKGDIPLHRAVLQRNLDAIKLLVENGADVNIKNYLGETPLDRVITYTEKEKEDRFTRKWALEAEEIEKYLVEHGAKRDLATEEELNRQLLDVIYEGWTGDIRRILEAGADPNLVDSYGDSMLHIIVKTPWKDEAYDECVTEICQLLLDYGADASITDENGKTPAEIAEDKGHDKVALFLYKNGSKAKKSDRQQLIDDLYDAAMCGDIDEVKKLVKAGANVRGYNKFGWTPLHAAHSTAVAAFLIENGADVNAKTRGDDSHQIPEDTLEDENFHRPEMLCACYRFGEPDQMWNLAKKEISPAEFKSKSFTNRYKRCVEYAENMEKRYKQELAGGDKDDIDYFSTKYFEKFADATKSWKINNPAINPKTFVERFGLYTAVLYELTEKLDKE